jgi:hypothetical protein
VVVMVVSVGVVDCLLVVVGRAVVVVLVAALTGVFTVLGLGLVMVVVVVVVGDDDARVSTLVTVVRTDVA